VPWIWIHEISQSALAGAVLLLGLVILLELRAIARLRSAMEMQLGRVFEQLDLLRFENQQLLEAQEERTGTGSPSVRKPSASSTTTAAATMMTPKPSAEPAGERTALATGEARLLASLAAARARRLEARRGESVVDNVDVAGSGPVSRPTPPRGGVISNRV